MIRFAYIIICSFFFLSSSLVCGEEIKNDSLNILDICNKEFRTLIDGVIMQEKKCPYYSPDLAFYIKTQRVDAFTTSIRIESIHKVGKLGNELGCFFYNNHFFIVTGDILDRKMFISIDKKFEIKYYEDQSYINHKDGSLLIDVIEDDTFSSWEYLFKDSYFVLHSHFTICE